MKKYLILLLTGLIMAACDDDDNIPFIPVEDRSTMLIYMAADNNLSDFAPSDIKEIKEASKHIGDNQTIVLFVDMANSDSTYIAKVKNGVLVDSVAMEEKVSADPAVLEEMLRYTRERYPAKDYGLCLWGHACGVYYRNDTVAYAQTRVYGQDTHGLIRWMNIPSMARAIENGMGGERLRYVFADCCNMSCVEIGYELRHVADYLIASPAEIPDYGAPYHTLLPRLFSRTDRFYEDVIDAYYDYYMDEFRNKPNYYYMFEPGDLAGYSVPLAVLKSSELENLAQETAKVLKTLGEEKLAPWGSWDEDSITHYTDVWTVNIHYDMQHFMLYHAQKSDYDRWKLAFDKAVPYSKNSGAWLTMYTDMKEYMQGLDKLEEKCGLVSMFVPLAVYSKVTPNLNKAIFNYEWNNVVHWENYGW